MIGRVDAYDPVGGFGFVKKDGVTYFAHNSEVRLEMPVSVIVDLGVSPPAFLLPGWHVEFEPVKQPGGRWKAVNIVPLDPTGFSINPVRQRPAMSPDGVVMVEVADNAISILGRPVDPVIKAQAFGIYYLGKGTVTSFSVKVPQASAERAFVVITPSPEKALRQATPDGLYANVRRGSFVMAVWCYGNVVVRKVGTHVHGMGENWLMLSIRFEHKYDFSAPTKEGLTADTPDVGTDSNRGFVPGILRGLELMEATVATK